MCEGLEVIKEFRLTHELARNIAIAVINQLPVDSEHPLRIVIDEEKRSNRQNSLMWAMMTDLSNQVNWCGKKRPKETWKTLVGFQALKEIAEDDGKEFTAEYIQSLDKSTLLSVDVSTSKMNKKIFSKLIFVAQKFGAEEGVIFGDEAYEAIKLAEQYKDQLSKVA